MAGPPPKDSTQRRRRNAPTAGEWITLPDRVFDGPRPKLPSRVVANQKPLAATIATWELWWASPVAWMWTNADWPGLLRLIALVETLNRTGKLDYLKELRLQEDRFGLSPAGRQKLRWRMPEDTAGDTEIEPSRPARFKNLRVVG